MKIRSTRLEGTENVETTLLLEGKDYKVIDVSLSGIKFVSKQEITGSCNAKVMVNEECVYEGELEVMWGKSLVEDFIYGGRFVEKLIRPGTIEALKISESFVKDYEQIIQPVIAIEDSAKLVLFEFQNILIAIKEACKKLDAIAKNQTSDVVSALDYTIKNLYLTSMHPKIVELSKKLSAIYDQIKEPKRVETFVAAMKKTLGPHLLQGRFGHRASTKPLGYAGDYELMSQIYSNESIGNNFFEKLMHSYAVNEISSESVRYRRKYIKEKIKKYSDDKKEFNILSVASGPASELRDFFKDINLREDQTINVYLLDGDINALIEAKNHIDEIKFLNKSNINVEYLHHNITDILTRKIIKKEILKYGSFDFVYSMGLFDYLDDRTAGLLVNELTKYLADQGKMIIGNFHYSNPTKAILDIIVDWKLNYRNEEQMLALAKNSKKSSITFDKNKVEMFLETEI